MNNVGLVESKGTKFIAFYTTFMGLQKDVVEHYVEEVVIQILVSNVSRYTDILDYT